MLQFVILPVNKRVKTTSPSSSRGIACVRVQSIAGCDIVLFIAMFFCATAERGFVNFVHWDE